MGDYNRDSSQRHKQANILEPQERGEGRMKKIFRNYDQKNFFNMLFIFRERRGEGGKHQCVFVSHMAPSGDLACNPGMCPDWELNWQPFGSQPVLNPLSYSSQGRRFPNLMKTTNPEIQEAQQIPRTVNTKTTTPRHIINC